MINNTKISVITVVFNGAKTLESTIQSVITQTYKNIEYIIIDGGSNDGTIEIIKKYENKIKYWISEPDNGIYDAINKGLKYASGDFAIIMGADDLFFKNSVITDVCNFISDNNNVYYGNAFFEKGNFVYDYKFNKIKLCHMNICQQCIFYPQKIYKNFSFNTNYKIFSDWDYNIRIWNQVNFIYIPIIISIFSAAGISSCKRTDTFIKSKSKILKGEFGLKVYCFSLCISFISRCFHFISHYFYKISSTF